tara:strand:+ start:1284 stop:1772 length:489 start_codon:yes stop_codon:yes gene_type:complete
MTTIKKDYQAIIAFLEANKNKHVKTILEELKGMCTKKTNDKTFELDEDGNVLRVFCYYHKCWEDVDTYTYGPKKNTASGLNTMCKEGVSQWTKQQRVAKQSKELLLTKLGTGELEIDDLAAEQELIERTRIRIVQHSIDVKWNEEQDVESDDNDLPFETNFK